ncbi:hypothetical protein [Litoreibacter janthinus]|uniref:Uncharacterized protein n=1 Tax=Litoreibacter janthinus TaxID=670154 RepID=A0A1I6HJH9_9RHOB|nr:hypothetical protein [Litoreibacter janthinus]SFR54639.1 hypothetical protein SAMN04488002_3084 [Litoreibacter janthinus]
MRLALTLLALLAPGPTAAQAFDPGVSLQSCARYVDTLPNDRAEIYDQTCIEHISAVCSFESKPRLCALKFRDTLAAHTETLRAEIPQDFKPDSKFRAASDLIAMVRNGTQSFDCTDDARAFFRKDPKLRKLMPDANAFCAHMTVFLQWTSAREAARLVQSGAPK